MNLTNLDPATRAHMRAEVERDLASEGGIYLSDRLSDVGLADWVDLFLAAVDSGDSASLTWVLNAEGRLNTHESYVRNGILRWRNVPYTAAETLAEGEFNRFYIRAVCTRAIAEGVPHVQVYRAKAVAHPRPESTVRIRALLDPQTLLDDLRVHNHVDTALGVPAGPNSGLSVQLSTP